MSFAQNVNETNNLINRIDRYITDHESQQLELLKDLAILSKNVYGYDKTIEKYSENIELFQSFFSTKNQLNSIGEHLADEEKAREAAVVAAAAAAAAAEDLKQKQQIEKQQKLEQTVQTNETLVETVDFVSKPFIQEHQVYDLKVTESRQKNPIEQSPPAPPHFIVPLCDVTVQEGESYQFMCQLQSIPPDTQIEWFVNGLPIKSYSHYIVSNENSLCTLSIKETFTEDAAQFTCRATNHMGFADTSARLFVQQNEPAEKLFPPNFINPLTDCRTVSGSSLLWKCFVEGNPLPTIQWFKNDVCIDVSPRYNISYNNGEATLRLDDLTIDDAGIYKCIAKNILGVHQCSAILNITAAPQSIDSVVKNG